jgi:monoamine oxidase
MPTFEIDEPSPGGESRNWQIDPARFGFAPKKLRVVCIGAGFSGLIFAHKVKYEREYDDVLEYTIYEKNSEVGGTWLENMYPGVAW